MLSVVIPSYKDPLLHKTIESLLLNSYLGEDLEVIVVLDGYWPERKIRDDVRVRVVHLGKNRGMREAINAGVSVARGDMIMRTDEHCIFAPGYDEELTKSCKPNWIMTATRYFLDTENWEIMDKNPVIYEKLKVREMGNGKHKWEGRVWHKRTRERASKDIDETMAMQGSMWIMHKQWWDDVIKKLDTRYGDMYQDSHEMIFKTWKAGGKMMVNKNTWFAHKHVSFPRTHNHPRREYIEGMQNCYEDFKDFYEEEVVPKWFQ